MKTVSGLEVDITKNDHHPIYPIIGFIVLADGRRTPASWTKEGKYDAHLKRHAYDLRGYGPTSPDLKDAPGEIKNDMSGGLRTVVDGKEYPLSTDGVVRDMRCATCKERRLTHCRADRWGMGGVTEAQKESFINANAEDCKSWIPIS